MAVIPLRTRCRINELSPFGLFVYNSYVKNQADFEVFSPIYTVLYGTNMELDRKAIDALINPVQMTGELKVITQRIYSNQVLVAKAIDFLEGYADRATGLTEASKDFGFSKVRQANNSGDIEAVVKNVRSVGQVADKNMAALTAEGYSAAKQTTLLGLADTLETENAAQNSKIDDRKSLVSDNHVAFNSYWDSINDLCDIGKKLYKEKTNENRDQYVVSTVLGRMRSDAAKTAVSGNTDARARIELKPLTTGRKRVGKADANGDYAIKGIAVGEYQATKTVKGKPAVVKTVVVESGAHVVENFD